MYFYQRLKDVREDHDKTQSEISKLLNMTQSQYARYETGKYEMPMHHFITLAKYYGVSLDYLAGIVQTPKPLKGSNEYSAEEVQLIRTYRTRPDLQGIIKAALGLKPSIQDPAAEMAGTLIAVANLAAEQAKKKTRSD